MIFVKHVDRSASSKLRIIPYSGSQPPGRIWARSGSATVETQNTRISTSLRLLRFVRKLYFTLHVFKMKTGIGFGISSLLGEHDIHSNELAPTPKTLFFGMHVQHTHVMFIATSDETQTQHPDQSARSLRCGTIKSATNPSWRV